MHLYHYCSGGYTLCEDQAHWTHICQSYLKYICKGDQNKFEDEFCSASVFGNDDHLYYESDFEYEDPYEYEKKLAWGKRNEQRCLKTCRRCI